MKNKLDSKNIELTKILFDLKQALDLHTLIGLNTDKINKKAGKVFFAYVQRIAMKSYVIDICKIYEEKKKNKLNSLPSIIDFIQGSKVKPLYPELAIQFIKNNGEKIVKNDYFGGPFNAILLKFRKDNKAEFKKLKTVRDSKIAHSEDSQRKNIKNLPSYDSMEKLLHFAVDFYSLIHETYIGGYPVPHKRDKRVFASLHTILKQLGYINIKTEFDD